MKKVFESTQNVKQLPESFGGGKIIKFANVCGLGGIVIGGIAGPYYEYLRDKKRFSGNNLTVEILMQSIVTVPYGMLCGGSIGWLGAGSVGAAVATAYAFSPLIAGVLGTTVAFSLPTVIYAHIND